MTQDVATESYQAELEQAFAAAGRISESLIALELFAADFDDDSFSSEVAQIRETSTRAGNRLAKLLQAERGE